MLKTVSQKLKNGDCQWSQTLLQPGFLFSSQRRLNGRTRNIGITVLPLLLVLHVCDIGYHI
jgi:hypothetical protein